jgi:CPA1 family monovalent cation:H+ antiporter
MSGGTIHEAQFLLIVLLVFIVGFGILAQRLKIAYPIVFVLGGLLVSLIPGLPTVSLNPDFIFLTVLPPLLFASATQTSWAEFKYNLISISSLAFGLVGYTVVGVSFAAHWLIPGFDWRLGLILGATVAPTDAIAATAIAQRLGLPRRTVELLEGESLVNDASGLLALDFSTALVFSGTVPSLTAGILRLFFLVAGGILVGLAIARVVQFIDSHVDNARIEIALSIVTPYAAYSVAEAVGVSGVLATVAAGLYLGRKTSFVFSSRVRIESQSFWSTFAFF